MVYAPMIDTFSTIWFVMHDGVKNRGQLKGPGMAMAHRLEHVQTEKCKMSTIEDKPLSWL